MVATSLEEAQSKIARVPFEAAQAGWPFAGLKATPIVAPASFQMTSRNVPVSTFHNRTVPSSLAVAKVFPSGENATQFTSPVCPERTTFSFPVATSQTQAVLSSEPVATKRPLAEKATKYA